MKALLPAAVLLIAMGSPMALAQNHSTTPPSPENSSHSGGTAPENMGSTGWTGGTGGSHIGTSNSQTTGSAPRNESSDPAADQPEMATGEDLKGPPTRFPANKTPE